MADFIGAVGLQVRDLARASAFYQSAFGMKQMTTLNLSDMDEIIMTFEGRGAAIVLMQYKDGRAVKGFDGKVVFYFDDVRAAVARLVEAGGAITREPAAEPSFGNALIGFGTDPDGYTLELIERPK